MNLFLILALQGATAPPVPERFSILAGECRPMSAEEVVVCGKAEAARLPLPAERGPPDRPVPSNPNLTGIGALAQDATPCAASQWGCQVGVDMVGAGVAAIRLVGKLIDPDSCCDEPGQATDAMALIRDVRGRRVKPDKANRVAIDLAEAPPATAGRLSP